MTLRVGVARDIITPPVGVELAGYGFGPSVGVLDDLEAQALYLEDEHTAAAIVTTDLLMLGPDLVTVVRQRLEATLGLPAEHVLLSASHTHAAPTAMPLRQWGRVDAAYLRTLEAQLTMAVTRAQADAQAARAGWGVGRAATIAENRRSGQRTIDPAVPVLRFDDADGDPLAVLFGYGCHPVSLHSYRNLLSPDYPGYTRAVIRCALGDEVVPMFALGPSGDVNPAGYVAGKTTPRRSRQIGALLGCEVARVALDPAYQDAPPLRVAGTTVQLPVAPLPPLAELQAQAARWSDEVRQLEAQDAPWARVSEALIRRDWARDAIQAREDGTLQETVPCEVQALRLGSVALLALPLEVFAATGLAIKEASPASATFVVTNANGAVGYLPVEDAYAGRDYTNPEGLAPKVYGLYALAPDAEPRIRRAAQDILGSLF
jgi:hypothetical protein